MRQRLTIVLATLACVVVSGFGSAVASASTGINATATKRVGLAGYAFTVGSSVTHVAVRGRVRIPTATCGKATRRYEVQIGASFTAGGQPEEAIVLIQLSCRGGHARPGAAQLVAGFHAKMAYKPIRPGMTMRVRVNVNGGTATAEIIYPKGRTFAVSAGGGKPHGVDYALTLPSSRPPHYAPFKFAGCFVNGRKLSAFHPAVWESVTKYHVVDGKVSGLAGGTAFTITR